MLKISSLTKQYIYDILLMQGKNVKSFLQGYYLTVEPYFSFYEIFYYE